MPKENAMELKPRGPSDTRSQSDSSHPHKDSSSSNHMNNVCSDARCTICAKLPFRGREIAFTLLLENGGVFDFDVGMFEVMQQANSPKDVTVNEELANKVTDAAMKHVKKLQRRLSEQGLMHTENQNFSGMNECARVVAPFDRHEVKLGHLLGNGGFSLVYEVASLHPKERVDAAVSQTERAARIFLKDHAIQTTDLDAKTLKKRPNLAGRKLPRYAMKHLRAGIGNDPERFERAAVDLVLEGQLLLALDHPHIVTLRGWSFNGPGTMRSGKYTDYFLILDMLPETLEERLYFWRHSLRKYQSRMSLCWGQQKFAKKIDDLWLERLTAAHDIASAITYMHERRVINRDIKVANVGFDVHGDIKVFDLGLSRLLPSQASMKPDGYEMSRVGTKFYMAPEVRNKMNYDLSADVYSFGIVLWEILALSTPREMFKRSKRPDSHLNTLKEWLPMCPCWPLSIQDLVRQCLSAAPRDRPTITQALHVLQEVMVLLGSERKQQTKKKRRSTFRLDLSQIDVTQLERDSTGTSIAESKTSLDFASSQRSTRMTP